MAREKNGMWKGGKTITRGYIYIACPSHPNATQTGYVSEHRLVMERMIGRYLEKGEIVHHLNRVKTDNRPENLEIVSRAGHVRIHNPRLRYFELKKERAL